VFEMIARFCVICLKCWRLLQLHKEQRQQVYIICLL